MKGLNKRNSLSCWIIVILIILLPSRDFGQASAAPGGEVPWEFIGELAHGLRPTIWISDSDRKVGWTVAIAYSAEEPVRGGLWLLITNRVGARIRLLSKEGREIRSSSPDVTNAMLLPGRTTVAAIQAGFPGPRQMKGSQWLRLIEPDIPVQQNSICLRENFQTEWTNDNVLEITPILYKVEPDGKKADLVQFKEFNIELKSDGTCRKVEPTNHIAN